MAGIIEVRAFTDGERTAHGLSEPTYAIDDQGRAWVRKVVSRDELRAECLGWKLSRALGVRTPECGAHRADGELSFFSALVRDVLHWGPARDQNMNNLDELGFVLGLDAIIGNSDRNEGNLLFHPNPDMLDLFSIDVANAVIGSPLLFEQLDVHAASPGNLPLDVPVGAVRGAADAFAQRARDLPRNEIVDCVIDACEYGGWDQAEVDILIKALVLRCNSAPTIVRNYLDLIEKRT